MILDEMKKVIKQNCKRQGRNITTGMVVAFLLGVIGTYAEDIKVEDVNGSIQVSQNGNKIEKGINIDNLTKTLTFKNDFNNNSNQVMIDKSIKNINIINKGVISSSSEISNIANRMEKLGNGIYISEDSTINTLTNYGTISGNSELLTAANRMKKLGNGIYIFEKSTINTLTNYGTISGSSKLLTTADCMEKLGNGISTHEYLDKLTSNNLGLISGNLLGTNDKNFMVSMSGNGILFLHNESGTPELNLTNDRVIAGNVELTMNNQSGDGIQFATGNIENNGLIKGSSIDGKDSGIGIFFHEAQTIINNGVVQGEYIQKKGFNMPENISGSGIGGLLIELMINKGLISGKSIGKYIENTDGCFGNGVFRFFPNKINLLNIGMIFGNNEKNINNSGNGILYNYGEKSEGIATNSGTISGYTLEGTGSGNGIYNIITIIPKMVNSGVISGTSSGITENSGNGIYQYIEEGYSKEIKDLSNYGLIAGSNKAVVGVKNLSNYGILIGLNDSEKIRIGEGGTYKLDIFDDEKAMNYTILNTKLQNSDLDAYQSFEGEKEKTIINGAGLTSGTVTVENGKKFSLTDGIVNAYKTAVTVGSNSEFTGTNVIINGGGLRDSIEVETPIIAGTEENNTLTLAGKIQLNGSVDLFGGKDKDTFNFGKDGVPKTEASIYKEIKNIENINVTNKSDITLYETAKITGTEKLNIEAGSQMTLRVDSSEGEKDKQGEIIYKKHALYNDGSQTMIITTNTEKIEVGKTEAEEKESENVLYSNVPVLNLKTSGLGLNSIISFGNVKFAVSEDENIVVNPDKYKKQNDTLVWVKTDSILHRAEVDEGLNANDKSKYNTKIKIEAEKDLYSIGKKVVNPDKPIVPPVDPDKPNGLNKYENLYVKLNEIYKGIHTSGNDNFNALNDIVTNYTFGDKDKGDYPVIGNEKMQMATLLGYLRSVYSETPYSFSNESTRKSMELFHDTVRDNNFKAKKDEWLIYGGLVHQSGDQEQTYYGRNYHGFDTGTADTDAEIKLTGAYGQFEYGNTDTLSTGIMVGGTKSDVEVASSKLKETGAYAGVYAKKDIKDLRLTAGVGYQYTEYDSTRRTINQTYSEDYKDKAFNLYLDGKYSYDLGNNLYLVSKAGLSYTHIDQDGIKESNDKALALNIDSKEFDVLEGTVGVDIKKVIPTEKGKHSVSAGVSYRHILDGADADYLTADFGGQDFEILVPHKNKGQMSIGVRYEAELENGMFYDVKGNYFMNVDSKENTHKNADRGEWRVGVGIGYKFTTLKDLALTSLFDFGKSEIRPEGKEF